MLKLITNVRIVDGGQIAEGGLLLSEGKVAAILPPGTLIPEAQVIDGQGLYASAGFIDMHTHGAGGADFMDGTKEAYLTACRMHLIHGTTTIFPTTLSGARAEILRSIDAYHEALPELSKTQFVPGLHLEGPYFSMEMRGGQDARYVRDPDPDEYTEILERADGSIARWSVAPEKKGALELGDVLTKRGILASIGHTSATYDEVKAAMAHGYSHITHLYSCTSSIVRKGGFRILGVTEAAYALEDLDVEIIADGCHLPPELIRMIVRLKGTDKVSLITDSLRPTGLDVLTTRIGSNEDGYDVIIEDGVAKLPDRSAFAGSIATADRLVRTVWKKAGIPLPDVIRMMCETPARIMKIDGRKGRLTPGMDADIVLFDEDVTVKAVYYMGEEVPR